MAETKKQIKFNNLDLIKFLMSICVVAIHTRPLVDTSNPALVSFFSAIINSAVPFFFLSSGYLLSNKFKSLDDYDNNIIIIRKYLYKIIKLYLFWSVVYLPLAVIKYIKDGNSLVYSILSYFRSLIFIGEHYNSWMLWYLLSTIYALFFFMILYKKRVSVYVIVSTGFLLTIIGLLFDYFDSIPSITNFLDIMHKIFLFTFSQGRIFKGLFLIPCGIVLKHKKIPLNIYVILFSLFFILEYFTSKYVVSSINQIFYSIGLFGIIEKIKLPDLKIFPILRKMSTGIYFIHMYVYVFFCNIVYGKEKFGIITFIATSIISVIISFIWIFIKPKFNYFIRNHNRRFNRRIAPPL